jgi:hypothetical protein
VVHDDPALLDKLFQDMASASEVWKPTNFWEVEEKVLMPTIKKEGIAHFRASYNSAFITVGVTSIPQILTEYFLPRSTSRTIVFKTLRMLGLNDLVFRSHIEEHKRTLAAFQNTCFQLVLQCDADKEILTIADSGLASPRDIFSPEGHKERQYTTAFLRYFWQYLWLKQFVDFKRIKIIMDLAGCGKIDL